VSPSPPLLARAAILLVLSLFLPACGGWLSMNRVSNAQRKPNNAWVFFSVERLDAPVTGLTADDFTISEDGNPIASDETKQLLQSPDVAAVSYTLLLVDLSGTSAAAVPDPVVDAAKDLTERLSTGQRVGVYAYDGQEKIHPIVPFSADGKQAPNAFDALRKFRTKDSSTNLHGAVVEGLRELKRALDRERRPLRFGTLVVLARGIDQANRVSRDAMRQEWDDDKYKLYEIYAAGGGAEHPELDDVGRDGIEAATDRDAVGGPLDRLAAKVEAHAKRYYLLSFCTKARKGDREIRVQARTKNPDASGSFTYTFNADGLGPPPECDPKTPPSFDLKAPQDADKEKERDDAPAKRSPKNGAPQLLIDTPAPDKPPPSP